MTRINLATLKRVALGVVSLGILLAVSGFTACGSYGGLGNIIYPSPTPGPVVLTPTSLSLKCALNMNTGTFTASQVYYSGTFTAMSGTLAAATVTATSPPNTFLVTQTNTSALGSTITVTGGGGQQNTLSVTTEACSCVRHHDMWEQQRR